MTDISHGAIGLIDALGVRRAGDLGRGGAEALLDTLEQGWKTAEEMKKYVDEGVVRNAVLPKFGVRPSTAIMAFSDTIAVSATLERSDIDGSKELPMRAMLIDVVCQIIGYVQRKTAQMEFPLVYRGVVTEGPLLVRGSAMLGAAIDEAAELYEQAEAAIVWLAPRALALPEPDYGGPRVWQGMMHPYAVPLKGGQHVETKAISPFLDQAPGIEEREKIRAGYLKAMASDALPVAVKRQQTMQFIQTIFNK